MSDLRVHATVGELLAYLGIDEDPEKFLDQLSTSKSTHISKVVKGNEGSIPFAEKVALKAAQLSQDAPSRFISVSDRLAGLKTKELEPLLYILNKVQGDPTIAAALSKFKASTMKTKEFGTPKIKELIPKTPGTGMSRSRSYGNITGSTQVQVI